MSLRQAALSAALLAILCASGVAHSNLADPLPTRRLVCRAGNGQPRDCYGPCPPMDTFGNPNGINEGNPATTWARGSTQSVAYQRNNHRGNKNKHGPTGFMRLTLVPVDKMMSKETHDSNAFHISCWGAEEHDCPSRDANACGNDESGRRYRTSVKIPTNYPDGVYVLGYSWYGGGDYKEESFFGDYYSCSFVRIQGGTYTEGSTTAIDGGGECWSATDRPGVCSQEPCLGKGVSLTRPHMQNGGYVAPAAQPANNEDSGSDRSDSGSDRSDSGSDSSDSGSDSSDSGAGDQGSGSNNLVSGSNNLVSGSNNQESGSDVIARILMVDLATSQSTDLWSNSLGYFKAADYPRGFNVEVQISGSASHVEFEWEGNYKREGTGPYLLAGNIGAKYGRWRNYPKGYDFTLTVNAYVSGKKHSKYVQLRID